MARLRGKPLADYNRADMEALEERVEAAALNRHLARYEDDPHDREDER